MLAILTLSDAASAALPAFTASLVATLCSGGPGGEDQPYQAKLAAAALSALPAGCTLPYARARPQRFTLLPADASCGPLLSCLEACKAADLVIVLLPTSTLNGNDDDAVSYQARTALACLRAQGLPPLIGAVVTSADPSAPSAADDSMLHDAPPPTAPAPPRKQEHRLRLAQRKCAEDVLAAALGAGQPRALPCDPGAEAFDFLRHVSDVRLSPPVWRTLRPFVLVEAVRMDAKGVLCLTGHVRGGPPLSANQLGYLPGLGTFQFQRIDEAAPLEQPKGGRAEGAAMEIEHAPRVLSTPHPEEQEPLTYLNTPDPLVGEQTWPSDAEMAAAAAEGEAAAKKKKTLLRRPKGWSDYQAAWIPADEEEEVEVDESDEEGGAGAMEDDAGGPEQEAAEEEEEEEEEEGDFLAEGEETQDEAMAAARHDSERRLALRRAAEAAEAEEEEGADADYPDEVDVNPGEEAARVRFGRYRGLKSFRSSAWDPYESLPLSYAHCFAFQSFARTRRAALARCAAGSGGGGEGLNAAPTGSRVEARLLGVSPEQAAQLLSSCGGSGSCALVLLGLLQHEAKLSVLHAAVMHSPSYPTSLRSKQALEMHLGFRRMPAGSTLFSADAQGDKHKLERFLRPRVPAIATRFAPIAYGPAPALLFDASGGEPVLAASGSLRPCAPERVILKRAVITGYPAKVHKRKAVVRFMFHTPEDVRWFRPLELWTKHGRHGKIREPIGTHGSMKCAFDGVLQQRDTICASLYKRVFPKLEGLPTLEAGAGGA